MKTIALLTTVTLLTLSGGTGLAQASDLSRMFRALEATQQTSAPVTGTANRTAPQPSAARTPRLMLGAWLSDVKGRLIVTGTVAGSTARQTLQPGDALYRMTLSDGRDWTLRTLNQFEYAKRQIGAGRQCILEVYRPGTGIIPMTVTFETNGGLANIALGQPIPVDGMHAPGLASR